MFLGGYNHDLDNLYDLLNKKDINYFTFIIDEIFAVISIDKIPNKIENFYYEIKDLNLFSNDIQKNIINNYIVNKILEHNNSKLLIKNMLNSTSVVNHKLINDINNSLNKTEKIFTLSIPHIYIKFLEKNKYYSITDNLSFAKYIFNEASDLLIENKSSLKNISIDDKFNILLSFSFSSAKSSNFYENINFENEILQLFDFSKKPFDYKKDKLIEYLYNVISKINIKIEKSFLDINVVHDSHLVKLNNNKI